MRGRPGKFVSEIEALRNLGSKSVAWLADVGLHSRAELAAVGAIEACRRLRRAGHPVTTVMAYAIGGALMDCDCRALPFAFRQHLTLEFQKLRRESKTS